MYVQTLNLNLLLKSYTFMWNKLMVFKANWSLQLSQFSDFIEPFNNWIIFNIS